CDPASREFFFNISSNALKSCNTTNTWTAIGGGAAGSGSFGAGSPWAPFGWNVGSSGDIYAGDSPGAQVCAAVVPPLSATFTKVGLYVLSWPTSGGQGLSLGLYSAAGTRLGYASAPNPGSGTELVLMLDTPVSLTAGTLYFQCTATEGAATLMTAFSIYGGYFMSLTGTTDTLIFNGNPATGSGATFAVSTTMGTRNGSTYHTAPLTVYLP
ncbi:MAG TPA: hypothetical protein VMZ52_14190, partial [Bryobacteraceae bacterium]|nr:hypothetical protein [Bryobacteraceae bacterium]